MYAFMPSADSDVGALQWQAATIGMQDMNCCAGSPVMMVMPMQIPPMMFVQMQQGAMLMPQQMPQQMQQQQMQQQQQIQGLSAGRRDTDAYRQTSAQNVSTLGPEEWKNQLDRLEALDSLAINFIRENARKLAFDRAGCRLLQSALESDEVDQSVKAAIAESLRESVQKAAADPHANHVLQKIIEVLPNHLISFIPQELSRGDASEVARNGFSHRIVMRLVEHASDDSYTGAFLSRILENSLEISNTKFGTLCVQHILQHGSCEQQARIGDALRDNLVRLAKTQFGSYVVEKALECPEISQAVTTELSRDQKSVKDLACHKFGSHVLKKIMDNGGDLAQIVTGVVSNNPPSRSSRHGKRCQKTLGLTRKRAIQAVQTECSTAAQ